MIQTFTFHAPLGEHDAEQAMQQLRHQVGKLLQFQHVLRGFTVSSTPDTLVLMLRVSGHNRWSISADAKRLVLLLMQRAKLQWRHIKMISFVTEPNGQCLKLGEGRTEAERSPKGARQRWNRLNDDRSDWWGDTVGSL